VQQTAEQVEPMPPALELIADDRQSGGRVWRFASNARCGPLDPALRVRVRPWCPHWRDQDLGVLVADHIVEGAGELRVMVWEQGAQLSSSFLKHQQ
jgi:hypothetical protein